MTVKDNRHPLLDPTITLGHILTALPLLISMIWYMSKIDSRIAQMEQLTAMQREVDVSLDQRIEAARVEIDKKQVELRMEAEDRLRTVKADISSRLDKLEAKLDRILDFIVETHPK
jgi:ABC-type phosphate transport system auxiliary subunit